MKKLVTGLTIAAVVCGGSTIALASKVKSMNESNNNKNIRTEIENYIVNKYGNDWANSLYNKNGEKYIVDSSHLVLWDSNMDYYTELAGKNIATSIFGGEGFVANFTGPGEIWIQTRKPIVIPTTN